MSDRDLITRHLAPLLRLIRAVLDPNDPPHVPPASLWVIKEVRERTDQGEVIASEVLVKLGNIEFGLGESNRAQEYYKQAALQAESDGARDLAATALSNSGAVYLGQHQFQMALRMYQRALGHASAIDDVPSRVSAMIGMGMAFKSTNQDLMARRSFSQAVKLANEHGLADAEGRALQQISYLDYAAGSFESAIDNLCRALDIYARTGNLIDQVRAYFNLGLVLADSGDPDGAIRQLERARELRDQHHLEYGGSKIESVMDDIRRAQGRLPS